jgi:Meiotically up-regulated gene 113
MPDRRRKRRPQAAPGGGAAGEVVYFVRAGDAIKIGRTANLAARLRALATASAVPLELLAAVPGGRELEARLHRRWRHLHLRGEWFRADEALMRYTCDQAGSGRAPEPDPLARAQAAQFRRVLAALDPAGLAAAGLG